MWDRDRGLLEGEKDAHLRLRPLAKAVLDQFPEEFRSGYWEGYCSMSIILAGSTIPAKGSDDEEGAVSMPVSEVPAVG